MKEKKGEGNRGIVFLSFGYQLRRKGKGRLGIERKNSVTFLTK